MQTQEQKDYHRNYYLKHKKHILKRNYDYLLNHPEQRRETGKKYNAKRIKVMQRIMIDLKINGCAVCGYNECDDALDFHHVNPEDKKFGLRQTGLWHCNEKIADEVNKCILLCANCHRELHKKERTKC